MDNKVECPVCSKKINSFLINEHVNQCLNKESTVIEIDDTDRNQGKKRKSNSPEQGVWGFLQSNKNQKRIKLQTSDNTETNDKNKNTEQNKSNPNFPETLKITHSTSGVIEKGSRETKIDKISNDTVKTADFSVPLAEQMRPLVLDDYVGQDKAVGRSSMLRSLLQSDNIPSLLLWGPPGCGKTTLARIVAKRCKGKYKFVQLSATSSGVNDVKETIRNAKNDMKMFKKRTILFLDEIHRFNKLQQDSLLPHVEEGTITLIGATTENPSFQVNNALLSRCRVVCLEKLDNEQLLMILTRAAGKLGLSVCSDDDDENQGARSESDTESNGCEGSIQKSALECLSRLCDGDARQALNSLQLTVQSQLASAQQEKSLSYTKECNSITENESPTSKSKLVITSEHIKEGLEKSHIAYDKTGEEHYNCASALIKSMRGSDDNAALYWLARMLEGGETPLFVARRLVIFASEDVGLADPQALPISVSTFQACHFLGMPECQINLSHCVVYLARAPKPVESFSAYNKAKACVHNHQGPLPPVPLHLRNAPTKLMKDIGYSKGYKYNPASSAPVKQEYFPESLVGTNFFK